MDQRVKDKRERIKKTEKELGNKNWIKAPMRRSVKERKGSFPTVASSL